MSQVATAAAGRRGSEPMKRHFFTAARLLLVVFGVTVIAFIVDWHSTVRIPPGQAGIDGA